MAKVIITTTKFGGKQVKETASEQDLVRKVYEWLNDPLATEIQIKKQDR